MNDSTVLHSGDGFTMCKQHKAHFRMRTGREIDFTQCQVDAGVGGVQYSAVLMEREKKKREKGSVQILSPEYLTMQPTFTTRWQLKNSSVLE